MPVCTSGYAQVWHTQWSSVLAVLADSTDSKVYQFLGNFLTLPFYAFFLFPVCCVPVTIYPSKPRDTCITCSPEKNNSF